MPPLKDVKLGGKFKAIFKGPTDSGKSCAVLSFPRPIYIFDVDGRIRSLAKFVYQTGFKDLLEDVDYDTYNSSNYLEFDKKVEYFKKGMGSKYKTIVLDSLTSMADLLIEYGNMQRGKDTEKGKWKGLIALPGFEEFGAESSGLSKTLEIFRSLDCHFILTAHEVEKRTVIPNQPDKVTYKLLTAGNAIAAKVPIYFGQIFQFNVDNPINVGSPKRFYVYAERSGDHMARTELPLPDKMEITGKKFYDVLKEELKKKEIEI